MTKHPFAFLRSNSLRTVLGIANDEWDITELRCFRKTEDKIKTEGRIEGSGVSFGLKHATYLTVQHRDTMTPLNYFSDEIFSKIDKLGLGDAVVDSCTLVSKKKITPFNDRVVFKFRAVGIQEPLILAEHEKDPNNDRLKKFAAKRGVLMVDMMCEEFQMISVPPSKRNYLCRLSTNWRDFSLSQDYMDVNIANLFKKLFSNQLSFWLWAKPSTTKKLEFVSVGGDV